MDETLTLLRGMLPLLVPVLVLEIALIVIALVDLAKRERVKGGNKVVWALVVIFIQIIGPIAYLMFGRKETPVDGD